MESKKLNRLLEEDSGEIFPIEDAVDEWENKTINDNENIDLYNVITGGGIEIDVIEPPLPTYGVDQEGEGEGSRGKGGKGRGGRRYRNKEILEEIIAKLNLDFTKKNSKYLEREEAPWISKFPSGSIDIKDSYIQTQLYKKLQKRKAIIDPTRALYADTIEEYAPSSAAIFVIIRDVSGSMSTSSKTAYTIAYMVDLALRKRYKNRVEHIYVAHTEDVWEEYDADSFFKLAEYGGTYFAPAYEYTYKRLYPLKTAYDLYVMHITDGENFDEKEFKNSADKMISIINRMFYIEIENGFNNNTPAMQYFKDKNKVRAIRIPNSSKMGDIVSALEKLFS